MRYIRSSILGLVLLLSNCVEVLGEVKAGLGVSNSEVNLFKIEYNKDFNIYGNDIEFYAAGNIAYEFGCDKKMQSIYRKKAEDRFKKAANIVPRKYKLKNYFKAQEAVWNCKLEYKDEWNKIQKNIYNEIENADGTTFDKYIIKFFTDGKTYKNKIKINARIINPNTVMDIDKIKSHKNVKKIILTELNTHEFIFSRKDDSNDALKEYEDGIEVVKGLAYNAILPGINKTFFDMKAENYYFSKIDSNIDKQTKKNIQLAFKSKSNSILAKISPQAKEMIKTANKQPTITEESVKEEKELLSNTLVDYRNKIEERMLRERKKSKLNNIKFNMLLGLNYIFNEYLKAGVSSQLTDLIYFMNQKNPDSIKDFDGRFYNLKNIFNINLSGNYNMYEFENGIKLSAGGNLNLHVFNIAGKMFADKEPVATEEISYANYYYKKKKENETLYNKIGRFMTLGLDIFVSYPL